MSAAAEGRRPARVLIVTIGTRGDVQPFIYLAQALQRAGTSPLIITLPHYVHLGVPFGVPMASILHEGETWPEPGDLSDEGIEDKEQFEDCLIMGPYMQHARSMLRRIEGLFSEHPPDLVVVGMIVWFVQWMRETLKAPLVHVHLQPTRWLSTERKSDKITRQARFLNLLAHHPLLDFNFMFARTEHAHELHVLAYPASLAVTHLPGILGTRTGFWTAVALGAHTDQPSKGARVPAELAAFLRGPGPAPVCLCFGSMPVYSRTQWSTRAAATHICARPLAITPPALTNPPPPPPTPHTVISRFRLTVRALLSTLEAHCRRGGRLLAIGGLVPPHVRSWPGTFVASSASHVDVLPQCACVIHHGGAGTTAAVITARRPAMIVPHLTWIDQTRWARWVEDSRAGVYVREGRRSSSDFAAALHRVLHDSSLRSGAETLAAQIATDRGVAQAVELILQRLPGGPAFGQLHPGETESGSAAEGEDGGAALTGAEAEDALTEESLIRVAREISGDDGFDAETPLFELGSLEMLELHMRIVRAAAPRPPPTMRVMLEQRTLRALAALLAVGVPAVAPVGAIGAVGAAATAVARLRSSNHQPGAASAANHTGSAARHHRCLFLHGEGASAELQRSWLERTGWLGCLSDAGADVVLIDAPLPCGAKPQLVPAHALDEYRRAGLYYSWGGSAHLEALEASLSHVDEALLEHSPIDAVGGFSQGALVAAATVASGRLIGLRWFLNVCGVPWQWLHVSMRANLPPITVPSLHLISEEDDTLSREQIRSLPLRCHEPAVVLHAHGHALPRLSSQLARDVGDFLARARSMVSHRLEAPPLALASGAGLGLAGAGGSSGRRSEVSDAFLWRKMVERQRRWFAQDAEGDFCRDGSQRFVPTPANPLPFLSPQDKLMQRRYLVSAPPILRLQDARTTHAAQTLPRQRPPRHPLDPLSTPMTSPTCCRTSAASLSPSCLPSSTPPRSCSSCSRGCPPHGRSSQWAPPTRRGSCSCTTASTRSPASRGTPGRWLRPCAACRGKAAVCAPPSRVGRRSRARRSCSTTAGPFWWRSSCGTRMALPSPSTTAPTCAAARCSGSS